MSLFLSPSRASQAPHDTPYPGKPLQPHEIRVVDLKPGAWNHPIVCELINVGITTEKYQALSYVWGSKHVTRPIRLNNRVYHVTVNLEGALRHLREIFKGRLFSGCIHQEDQRERTHQVQMMGKIYTGAHRVIVYLGDQLGATSAVRRSKAPPVIHFDGNNKRARHAFEYSHNQRDIYELFEFFSDLCDGQHLEDLPAFHIPVSIADKVSDKGAKVRQYQMRLFESIRRFTHAPFTPWWNRIWTVQEILLAQDYVMVYGTVSIAGATLCSAAQHYEEHVKQICCSSILDQLPRDLYKIMADFCGKMNELKGASSNLRMYPTGTLLDLLRRFRNRKASDARDKVYALLALVQTPEDTPVMVPDYSLSEVDVFRMATTHIIYASSSLSMFSTELGRKFRTDLPSWVPDWNAPGTPTYQSRAYAVESTKAWPSNDPQKSLAKVRGNTLTVDSMLISYVDGVRQVMLGDDADSRRDTLLGWWSVWENTRIKEEIPQDHRVTEFCHLLFPVSLRFFDSFKPTDGSHYPWIMANQLPFVTWSLFSQSSPFQLQQGYEDRLWSGPGEIWRQILIIWHNSTMKEHSLLFSSSESPYHVPIGRKDVLRIDSVVNSVRRLISLLQDSPFNDPHIFCDERGLKHDAPWSTLMTYAMKEIESYCGGPLPKITESLIQEWTSKIEDSIITTTLSRRLITDEHGNVGLAPSETLPGDLIFILRGGRTPFILRPKQLGTLKFEILGDCYLPGYMDDANLILQKRGKAVQPIDLV